MKKFMVLVMILVITSCTTEIEVYETDNILVVKPQVELLAGVLSQTSWDEFSGPKEEGSNYYRELKQFFDEYKTHHAIDLAEALTVNDFTYDAPLNFILCFENIDDLNNSTEYDSYIVERAGGKDKLDDFRIALYELALESNFYEDFYLAHEQIYSELILKLESSIDTKRIGSWMDEFYGENDTRCITVLAPALYPLGGYSVFLEDDIGIKTFYNVQRPNSLSNNEICYDEKYISTCTVHEWNHVYINPCVTEHLADIDDKEINAIYSSVEVKHEQAYNNTEVFLCDQIIRGITAAYVKRNMSDDDYQQELDFNEREGFYLTEYTVTEVEKYLDNKDDISYSEFVKDILKNYIEIYEEYL